jgi:acetyl esterase/lipase
MLPFLTVQDVLSLPAAPPDFRIPYGPAPAQYGELRLPLRPGPHPVAVVIHGGCWLDEYDLATTAPMADELRRAGCATWHLEYRRLDTPGGGWPGTFQDIGAGLDLLRHVAQRHALDLSRVATVGHSAGGHLALWGAARHRVPRGGALWSLNPLRVAGAVCLAGPGDLRRFIEYQESSCGGPVVSRLLGGWPAEAPDRYRAASPAEMLPLGVRQVLITGEHDPTVPPSLAAGYARAARSSGDSVDEIVVSDAAHFEVIAPGTVAWSAVEDRVRTLLGLVTA